MLQMTLPKGAPTPRLYEVVSVSGNQMVMRPRGPVFDSFWWGLLIGFVLGLVFAAGASCTIDQIIRHNEQGSMVSR
jgi:hypothetical protein